MCFFSEIIRQDRKIRTEKYIGGPGPFLEAENSPAEI
jgi:hypothetical protein